MAQLLDGKTLSKEIQAEIKQDVSAFCSTRQVTPKLVAVLVGEDPASHVYVRNKERACARVGIASELKRLPEETTTDSLLELVHELNQDPTVHGILVQLPLPAGVDSLRVLDSIDPAKDVDAFHPHNVGLISRDAPIFSHAHLTASCKCCPATGL